MNPKQAAAEKAVNYISDGMTIGLGTGSTAFWAIKKIGELVREGLRIRAIATSVQSQNLAIEEGISMVSFSDIEHIDVTIDGADEVDVKLNLIKGGGGALLHEKIVGASTKRYIIIVDESKCVNTLGKFPLPVEIVPFGWEMTMKKLQQLKCITRLRLAEKGPFITDSGHYISDCSFNEIREPGSLEALINMIPGVVENGLFVNMTNVLVVGYANGEVKVRER